MKYKIHKLNPKNRKDLFKQGAKIPFENNIIDNEKNVYKALIKREKEFTTNFGQDSLFHIVNRIL